METLSPRPCRATRSPSFSVSGAVARSLLHSPREKLRNGERSITSTSSVTPLPELAHRTHPVSPGGVREEQVVADQLLEGARYICVGIALQRVAEIPAGGLPRPHRRTKARGEDGG